MREKNIGYLDLGVKEGKAVFRLRDPGQSQAAREALLASLQDMTLNIEADGQAEAFFTEPALVRLRAHAIEQSIEIIRRRIDETGTREPTIIRQGDDRVLVQLPGVKDPQRVKALIGKTAKLTFRMVDVSATPGGPVPPTSEALPSNDQDSQSYIVQKRVMISGENLVDSQQTFQDGLAVVSFRFDSVGARRFGDATSKNVGKPFAIILDGKVISAPVIREPILGGSGIISGNFHDRERA